jgi:hypothetical protein
MQRAMTQTTDSQKNKSLRVMEVRPNSVSAANVVGDTEPLGERMRAGLVIERQEIAISRRMPTIKGRVSTPTKCSPSYRERDWRSEIVLGSSLSIV